MATLGIELFGLLFCGVSVCHELLISGIEGRTDRITYCFKGMNKNRVVNYRKLLEISTLLYCKRTYDPSLNMTILTSRKF